MLDRLVSSTCFVAALGSGLVAGVFFAFSSFVMPALSRVPPATAVASMNAINRTAVRPAFMLAFLGTAALSALLAAVAFRRWGTPEATLLVIGSVLYLLGSFGVTVAFNVPLNEALGALAPDSSAATALWPQYLRSWTRWNHVRTVASLAAMTTWIAVLVRLARNS